MDGFTTRGVGFGVGWVIFGWVWGRAEQLLGLGRLKTCPTRQSKESEVWLILFENPIESRSE
jgi:hypothetical protein